MGKDFSRKTFALIKKDFHSAGGLEKVTSHLLAALIKKGVDVSLFTAASSHIPCTTYSYRPKGLFKAQKLRDFDAWLSRNLSPLSFDVVLSMDRCSFQTHHRAGNGVHKAYLEIRSRLEGRLKQWSFAINPLHRLQLELEKKVFESDQTQTIIVNSSMVCQQILHYYKVSPSKIHVIHNGVEWKELETEFNDSLSNRKEHAIKLGLDPSVFQFLFIGHNFERKGLGSLLKALPLLSSKNFHLSIVGDDKKMESYQMLASSLGLESQVTFFGSQTSSRPFYLAADALVIPSMYDPFANVTVEALALGLFVVSSKMNGGHEVLQSHSGVIVENIHAIEELAAALEIALKHPKEPSKANRIRSSVAHLDYSFQLEKVCHLCLG
jgi:UDP-glucose:(heptosyl)LPS alpha-1,3-glucosyltransferase